MYARVTTVEGDPGRIDEVIRFVHDTVQPLLQQLPGSLGLAMFVHREQGRVTVTTAWTTAAARAASDGPLTPIRGEAARILGGRARVEEFELAVREQTRQAAPGFWSRATRLAVPVARLDEAIADFRDRVVPALRTAKGFCNGVLLVDRATGTAVASTTWDSRTALASSRRIADQLRSRAGDVSGARVTEVIESEIVLAGIVPPTQHEDTFRRVYAAMSGGGDLSELDRLFTRDYVEHAQLAPGMPAGLAGLKATMAAYRDAFPDLTIAIEKYLEQGDLGCAVVRITGTQTGPFLGAPPSGRAIDITGVDVARIVDGRCVEHWGAEDDLGMFTQLGRCPVSQQTTRVIELPTETLV